MIIMGQNTDFPEAFVSSFVSKSPKNSEETTKCDLGHGITPSPTILGNLILKNAGSHGGTCDLEKNVGGPPSSGETCY